jgi:hypothetical protein
MQFVERPDTPAQSYAGIAGLFFVVLGALGLIAAPRLDAARSYALFAGVAADTTNNITHAILAGLGLLTGLMPRSAQRPAEGRARDPRFRRDVRREPVGRS